MQSRDKIASLILLCHNLDGYSIEYLRDIHKKLSKKYQYFEIILTIKAVPQGQDFHVSNVFDDLSCIRLLKISGDPSSDVLAFAGLEEAIGDIAVIAKPFTDSAEDVMNVFAMLESGLFAVQGVSLFSKSNKSAEYIARKIYFKYLQKQLGINIPKGSTYLIGFSREAVNFATSASRKEVYIRHVAQSANLGTVTYEYEPKNFSENSAKFRTNVSTAIESVTRLTTHPLKMVSVLSGIAAALNLLYIAFILITTVTNHDLASGWASTSLQTSGMFLLISIVLGVQSEYIDRILKEIRAEPNFIVTQRLESSKMIIDPGIKNVVE